MRKVLVAVAPPATPILTAALESCFDIIPCLTLDEARVALRAGNIDLAVCGIHFDESRMLDLLRYAQADPATHNVPFLCMKVLDDVIAPTFLQNAEIASRALGAREFIYYSAWRRQLGDQQATEQLRQLILKLLP